MLCVCSHAAATYENVVYTKPYCRAAPYLVGMLLGYQLHADGTAKKRFPKARASVCFLKPGLKRVFGP